MVPLPGRGIATNAIKNSTPYLFIFFECSFCVFSNSFSRNLSIGGEFFLKNFETGSIKARKIAAGVMLPATANKNVLVEDNPSSIPRGTASFSSRKGTIAVKKTINSNGIILILTSQFNSLFFFR